MTDAKGAVYTFGFDALHRKNQRDLSTGRHWGARTETWAYDAAGNLILYKDPAGQYKHLDYADSYDPRNRLRHCGWNMSALNSAPD